ncbi:MAG: HepT-like ribonuclease domain-containing protein [Candidatus Woesearchaeota archaeon]
MRINQEILETHLEYIAQTYRESFEKLNEFSIFDTDTLKKLSNTTRFRNRLAHDYMDLDDNIVIKTGELIVILYSQYILKIDSFIKES